MVDPNSRMATSSGYPSGRSWGVWLAVPIAAGVAVSGIAVPGVAVSGITVPGVAVPGVAVSGLSIAGFGGVGRFGGATGVAGFIVAVGDDDTGVRRAEQRSQSQSRKLVLAHVKGPLEKGAGEKPDAYSSPFESRSTKQKSINTNT